MNQFFKPFRPAKRERDWLRDTVRRLHIYCNHFRLHIYCNEKNENPFKLDLEALLEDLAALVPWEKKALNQTIDIDTESTRNKINEAMRLISVLRNKPIWYIKTHVLGLSHLESMHLNWTVLKNQ